MSFLDGLFESPRQRKGEDLYGTELTDYDKLIADIMGQQSEFSGVSTLGDVQSRFGLQPLDVGGYKKQVGSVFAPRRANLSTQLARSRSSAASRMTGAEATPENIFAPIEESYAGAFSGLESEQAGQELQGYDKARQQSLDNAAFLRSILSGKESFNVGKLNRRGSALGAKGKSIEDYLGTQSGSSAFDDLLAAGGLVGDIAMAF